VVAADVLKGILAFTIRVVGGWVQHPCARCDGLCMVLVHVSDMHHDRVCVIDGLAIVHEFGDHDGCAFVDQLYTVIGDTQAFAEAECVA